MIKMRTATQVHKTLRQSDNITATFPPRMLGPAFLQKGRMWAVHPGTATCCKSGRRHRAYQEAGIACLLRQQAPNSELWRKRQGSPSHRTGLLTHVLSLTGMPITSGRAQRTDCAKSKRLNKLRPGQTMTWNTRTRSAVWVAARKDIAATLTRNEKVAKPKENRRQNVFPTRIKIFKKDEAQTFSR